MTNELAPYCMTNDNVVMMIFVMNIIGIAYAILMNGTGIIERLKCIFYYESKSTPYNSRTHITRICNVLMYAQTLFYSAIIASEYILKSTPNLTIDTAFPLMGTLILLFASVLLFKLLSYDAVNIILFDRHTVSEWISFYFFTIKLLGFALTPAIIAILFLLDISFVFVKIYLLIVLVAYVYTVINGLIKIIFAQRRNFLDIFLYLCALEVLPMGIVWKFVLQVSEFLTIKN